MNLLKSNLFWIITIFICAAIFRLTFLDLIEFKLDEARDVFEMEKFFSEPYFIQRGTIQSTGVYNPPLWYYILSVISLPSRNPEYLSFMIAFLNCIAVAGFYWVVQKFYGQFVGVVSGLILAFSPWMILYSRKIWAPDLVLVFLVPLFYFIHILFTPGESKPTPGVFNKWAWFWVVLLTSLLAQLHGSGLFFGVATAVVLFIDSRLRGNDRKWKFNFKYAILGLLISLITLLPYLSYQFSSECEDCQSFFDYRDQVKVTDINVFLRPFQLISGSSFSIVLGDDNPAFLEQFPFIKLFNFLFLLEFILGILGIIYIIKYQREYLFLIIYLAVIPLFYLITQTPSHMHYFLILSPILILLSVLAFNWFKKGNLRYLGLGIIGVVILINILFQLTFFQFLDEKQTIQGDYGPIFRVTKEQAEEKLVQYKGQPDYNLIKAEFYVSQFENLNAYP